MIIRKLLWALYIGFIIGGFLELALNPSNLVLQANSAFSTLCIGLSFWWAILLAFYTRLQAGKTLLAVDNGYRKFLLIFYGFMFFMLCVADFPLMRDIPQALLIVAPSLFNFFSMGVFFSFVIGSPQYLTEKGVCYGLMYIPWENIESYSWTGEKGETLTLKLYKRVLFRRKISFPIPPKYGIAVNSIFLQRVYYRDNPGGAVLQGGN